MRCNDSVYSSICNISKLLIPDSIKYNFLLEALVAIAPIKVELVSHLHNYFIWIDILNFF